MVTDMTEDDSLPSDRDVGSISDTSTIDSPAADLRGVMRLVSRELVNISETMPRREYQHMRANGVHIVLAIDNTSRQVFSGATKKLEQGCIEIGLPFVKRAQQPPSSAMSIFSLKVSQEARHMASLTYI
jgi:hypothetical protein